MLPPMIVYTWPPFPPLRVSICHLTGHYCYTLKHNKLFYDDPVFLTVETSFIVK